MPRLLLFVYGSLKRGQSNHAQLTAANFVASARTVPQFALRVQDGFPTLVPGTQSIRGELFAIPVGELPALDAFEGDSYLRCEIELLDSRCALTYMARDPGAGQAYAGDEWLGST